MGQNLGPLNIKDTYQSLVQISGSQLTDGSGSLISSLDISASYSDVSISASYAATASYLIGTIESASYATNATSASYALTATSATTATTATSATSASYALNATSADTATSASHALVADSVSGTVENAVSASYILGSGVDGAVATATSASHALVADSATTSTTATSASYAATATSASHSEISDFAASATSASFATSALLATSASHAVSADSATTATTATSASYATTASYAENAVTPSLDQVTAVGSVSTRPIQVTGSVVVDFDGIQQKAILQSTGPAVIVGVSGSAASTANLTVQGGQLSNAKVIIDAAGGTQINNALTASGIIYPTSDGSPSQVMTTDGAGNLSFSTISATPFPYSGSAIITGSLEINDPTDASTSTINNNEGTIIVSSNVSESYTNTIVGNTNSLIGGTVATDNLSFSTTFISGSTNSVILANRGGNFLRAVSAQDVTSSVILGSTDVRAGSGHGYTGNSVSITIIGSKGSIMGGVPYGGMYSVDTGEIRGNSNPRTAAAMFGGRNHLINAVYNAQVFGGNNNRFPTAFGGDNGQIFGGQNNTISGGGNPQLVGSLSSTIAGGASYVSIVGSRTSRIDGGDTVMILGGGNHDINYGFYDTIVGGNTHIYNNRSNAGGGNSMVAGYNNEINGSLIGKSVLLGGHHNKISGSISMENSVIVGSTGSLMQHGRSVILGGAFYSSSADDQVIAPQMVLSGSLTNAGGLLAMEPWATLPAAASHTNSFAVSGSKPYFSDGATWTALF